MNEIIERVARAIRAVVVAPGSHLDQDWKSIGEPAREMYRRDARAAIDEIAKDKQPCGVCGGPVFPELEKALK